MLRTLNPLLSSFSLPLVIPWQAFDVHHMLLTTCKCQIIPFNTGRSNTKHSTAEQIKSYVHDTANRFFSEAPQRTNRPKCIACTSDKTVVNYLSAVDPKSSRNSSLRCEKATLCSNSRSLFKHLSKSSTMTGSLTLDFPYSTSINWRYNLWLS